MSKNKKMYGNYKVYSPSGELMFLCNENRVSWYLKRNLAVEINPKEIKLTFEPKGLGYSNNDSFFFLSKKNICVVCGIDDYSKLSRHHIVPFCYRKWMSEDYKSHNCYDVVKMCRDCHDTYEKEAQNLKFKIAEELEVNINNKSEIYIKGCANTLLYQCAKLPDKVFDKLYNEISKFLGKEHFSDSDVLKIRNMNFDNSDVKKSWGQKCVEKIKDVDSFIIMWRQHFIDHAKPKFMPDGWEVSKCFRK